MLEGYYDKIFECGGKKKYQPGGYTSVSEEIDQRYGLPPMQTQAYDPYANIGQPMTAGTTGTSGPVMQEQGDPFGAPVENLGQNMTNNPMAPQGTTGTQDGWDGTGQMPRLDLPDLSQNQQQDIVVPEGIMEEDPIKNLFPDKQFEGFPAINPGGSSLESRAYMLGRGFGAEKGTKGKGLSIIGGIGSLGLGLTRNVMSGYATQKRDDWVQREYEKKQREDRRQFTNAPLAQNNNYTGGAYFQDGGTTENDALGVNGYTEEDYLKDSMFLYESTKPYAERGEDYYSNLFQEDEDTWKRNMIAMDRVKSSPEVRSAIERVKEYKGYVPEVTIGTTTNPGMTKTYVGSYFKDPATLQEDVPKEEQKPAIPQITESGAMAQTQEQYLQNLYGTTQSPEVGAMEKTMDNQTQSQSTGQTVLAPWEIDRELAKPFLDTDRRAMLEQMKASQQEETQTASTQEKGGVMYQAGGNTREQDPREKMFGMAQNLVQQFGTAEAVAKYLEEQKVDPQVYDMLMQIVVGMTRQNSEPKIQPKKKGGKISI